MTSNLARNNPESAITIPAQYREQKTEQRNILAIEVQDSPQDTKPLPFSKENVLILTNITQESSKDYSTCQFHLSQTPQYVEMPADKDLPSEAMSESVLTPSQHKSPRITEFLLCNPYLPPESIPGKHNGRERKYLTPQMKTGSYGQKRTTQKKNSTIPCPRMQRRRKMFSIKYHCPQTTLQWII